MKRYTKLQLIPNENLILDSKKINHIHEFLKKIWKTRYLTPNPISMPVSLERKDLDFLKSHQDTYVVSEKTDGVRYLLICNRDSSKNFYSVMVDRNFNSYEVEVIGNNSFFEGSIFDGELVWEYYSNLHPPRQMFYVFDVLCCKGIDCQTENYIQRLEVINNTFSYSMSREKDLKFSKEEWITKAQQISREENKIISLRNKNNLGFSSKTCFRLSKFDFLTRHSKNIVHNQDGLIFTPIDEIIKKGKNEKAYKWKWSHSLDFLFKFSFNCEIAGESKWDIDIYLQHEGKIISHRDIRSRGLFLRFCHDGKDKEFNEMLSNFSEFRISEDDKFLDSLTSHLISKNIMKYEKIIESTLRWSDEKKVFFIHPNTLRNDKNIPNGLETAARTMINVRENISMEEIRNSFSQNNK